MSVGARLRKIREYMGLSVASFADKLGEKDYKIRDSEAEKQKISSDLLEKIGISLNIDLNWLLTGQGKMFKSYSMDDNHDYEHVAEEATIEYYGKPSSSSIHRIEVPFYDETYASAGGGANNTQITTYSVMSFDEDFLKAQLGIGSFTGLHVITAIGDSMQNTFQSGELLFILPFESESNILRDNGIYVIHTPNGTIVKRIGVHPLKKSYILRSDNDDIPPIELEGDEVDACTIVGRVVAHFDRV